MSRGNTGLFSARFDGRKEFRCCRCRGNDCHGKSGAEARAMSEAVPATTEDNPWRFRPQSLRHALQAYLLWSRKCLELMEKVAKTPAPKIGKAGIPLDKYPVPKIAEEFAIIHQLRVERYHAAYKLADSEAIRTDYKKAPLAEQWSNRLRATLLRSSVLINTLMPIPKSEFLQAATMTSRNPRATANLRRGINDLEEFHSILGVLDRSGQPPVEMDGDATVDKAEKYLVEHEGATGAEVARAINRTDATFYTHIVPKLRERGWTNNRRTGYRRHKPATI